MTRKEMEKVITDGGAVLHQGRHINSVQDLPSEVDLAQGDEAQEDTILAGYDEQIKAIQKKKDEVFQARAKRTKNATQEPVKEPASVPATAAIPASAPQKEAVKEPQPAQQSEPAPQAQETQDDTDDGRHGRRKR